MTQTLIADAPADVRAAAFAQSQGGCVSRQQMHELGLTDRMISRRLVSGRWRHVHPGVYVLTGVAPSWLQDVWAAVLAVGEQVIVSHETVLLLHGLVSHTQAPRYPLVLTVPHGRHHRIDGVRLHQIDDVRPKHIGVINGLAVSKPERAIVDLAARAGERWLRELIDDLVTRRHLTLGAVSTFLHDVARPGKPGVLKLAEILDSLGDGYVPPASELERLLFHALEQGGLPQPVRQIPLPGRGAIESRADGGYEDAKVLLEADGRRWHTRSKDIRRDHARDAEAARDGWLTLRFLYEQLRDHPDEVAAIVADVRRVRLEQQSRQ